MVLASHYPFLHKSALLKIVRTHPLEQYSQVKGDVQKKMKGHHNIHMPREKITLYSSF